MSDQNTRNYRTTFFITFYHELSLNFLNYRFEGDGTDIVNDADSYCTSCSGAEDSDDDASKCIYDKGDDSEKLTRTNDDDTWTDDDENDATIDEKSSISRFKVSNTVQATHLLSDESINVLLVGDHCVKGRKCTSCPNDGDCVEIFGPIKSARDIIRTFRKKYWDNAGDVGQIYSRRKQLLQDLDTMKVVNVENSGISIEYKIEGRFVCKSFFHVSMPFISLSLIIH